MAKPDYQKAMLWSGLLAPIKDHNKHPKPIFYFHLISYPVYPFNP